jgi:hypothetical protein
MIWQPWTTELEGNGMLRSPRLSARMRFGSSTARVDLGATQSGFLPGRRYFFSNLRTPGLQIFRIYVTLAQPRLDADSSTVRIVRCGSLLGALQHTRLYGSRNLKSGVDVTDDKNE